MRVARWLRLPSVLLLLLLASSALATPKRDKQDYGGPPPAEVGPSLLWVPRVVLFPVWLVSEYVVREPVGALVRTAEKNRWPQEALAFFTFGRRQNLTIFPSVLFDFGLKPSVGFNLSWKYFLAEQNTLKIHFGTWGPDWVAVKARDEYALNSKENISTQVSFVRRRDLPFYGMGPRSPSEPRYRYQATTSEFALGYQNDFWRSSAFIARAGIRTLGFSDGGCCGNPALADAVNDGTTPSPPGYGKGYVAEFQSLSLALDSRRPLPANASGVRLEGYGETVFAPAKTAENRRAWVRYGGQAGVALDFWQHRVVALGVTADLVDPLVGETPFTDQVALGGSRPMRGYLNGRLIDRSALVGTVQYTWPIWVYLNGVMQVDVGNVFGPHFSGFEAGLCRLSTAIGIRSNADPNASLEVLVAGATDPFDEGFRYSSFRLVIGSHHGF